MADSLQSPLSAVQWESSFGSASARKWAAIRANLQCPFQLIGASANRLARAVAREAPFLDRFAPFPFFMVQICREEQQRISRQGPAQPASSTGTRDPALTLFLGTPEAEPLPDPARQALDVHLPAPTQRPRNQTRPPQRHGVPPCLLPPRAYPSAPWASPSAPAPPQQIAFWSFPHGLLPAPLRTMTRRSTQSRPVEAAFVPFRGLATRLAAGPLLTVLSPRRVALLLLALLLLGAPTLIARLVHDGFLFTSPRGLSRCILTLCCLCSASAPFSARWLSP